MPTVFTHAISALAIGHVTSLKNKQPLKFWLMGMFCAAIPDADVISFKFGIPYSHMFGHRGFTHSFFFAFIFASLIWLLFFRKSGQKLMIWVYLFLCTASHGILDAMTSGGRGIAFFAPFSEGRHFLPYRPIKVSPIGIEAFFSDWGWKVIQSEFYIIWIPAFTMIFLAILLKRRSK